MECTIKKNDDWQPSMRRNYRIKLGLGYDEAKFNYLNNSQFSCFYYVYLIWEYSVYKPYTTYTWHISPFGTYIYLNSHSDQPIIEKQRTKKIGCTCIISNIICFFVSYKYYITLSYHWLSYMYEIAHLSTVISSLI